STACHMQLAVLVSCAPACTFGKADCVRTVPFVDLVRPFTATSRDSLHASTDSSDGSSTCLGVSPVHEDVSVRLQRDATGQVTGFAGRYELRHPGGVEETTASGTCSTFD